MMMKDTLPLVKSFFQIGSFDQHAQNYIVRMIIAFIFHTGRMSASQVASSIRTDIRHRAQVSRFLSRSSMGNGSSECKSLAVALIGMESLPPQDVGCFWSTRPVAAAKAIKLKTLSARAIASDALARDAATVKRRTPPSGATAS